VPAAHWLQITSVATLQGTLIWTPLALVINSALDNEFIAGGPWITPDGKTIGLIILCAIFASAGLALNVIGYQIGEATKVAWMEYCDLIFAFVFQWALFNQAPNLWEWLGLLCLMSTCALHLGEEALKLRSGSSDHAALSHVTSMSNSLHHHTSNTPAGYTAIPDGHTEGVL